MTGKDLLNIPTKSYKRIRKHFVSFNEQESAAGVVPDTNTNSSSVNNGNIYSGNITPKKKSKSPAAANLFL